MKSQRSLFGDASKQTETKLPDCNFLNQGVGHLVKLPSNDGFLYCKAFGAAVQEVKKQMAREKAGLFAHNLEKVWPVFFLREELVGPVEI